MRLFLCILAVAALTGCRKLEVTLPNGVSIRMLSFGVKTTWDNFSISTNGLVRLDKLNSDQVTGMESVVAGAVEGTIKGMK